MADSRDFQVEYGCGPFGEIYPLPLLCGMSPDDAVRELMADTAGSEEPLDRAPSRGASREGLERLAAVNAQGKRIGKALDGELDQPEAKGLRALVVQNCIPMSMRPLFSEKVVHFSFAPVLQHMGDGRWRMGLPNYGARCETFTAATPGEAYQRAKQLYYEWASDEEEKLAEAARNYPRSLTADYYARLLEVSPQEAPIPFPNGWSVSRGKHDAWVITLGERGVRFVSASPPVVARAVLMLSAALQEPVPPPPPTHIIRVAMVDGGFPMPRAVGDQGEPIWKAEDFGFRWLGRRMPPKGRWGEISWKDTVVAALDVADNGRSVLLVGLQKPIAGQALAQWEPSEFQTLAAREDMCGVAPLFWAAREVAKAVRSIKQRKQGQ